MQTSISQPLENVPYTPAAAKSAGDIVQDGCLFGPVATDLGASEAGSQHFMGIVNFPKVDSLAISRGARLYWDADGDPADGTAGSGAMTTDSTKGVCRAISTKAAASGDAEVKGYLLPPAPDAVFQKRIRVTTAQVNAGFTLLPALAGVKYQLVDVALIAIGGGAATATTVDILATQSASGVKLLAAAVAGLTQNTLLRAGATNATILAAGASFVANDANTAITIGKTGSDLATATHIDVLISWREEAV
jgi:predicted RecA/RadA family phage recombinase